MAVVCYSAVEGTPWALLRQDRDRSEGGSFPATGTRWRRLQERRLFVCRSAKYILFCRKSNVMGLQTL